MQDRFIERDLLAAPAAVVTAMLFGRMPTEAT
jgi:hypothetical protein